MEFVNLTPHEFNLYDEDGNVTLSVPASGVIARATETIVKQRTFFGAPMRRKEYSSLYFMNQSHKVIEYTPDESKINIVSTMCLPAIDSDLLGIAYIAPDTGVDTTVRNGRGQITGVRGWQF